MPKIKHKTKKQPLKSKATFCVFTVGIAQIADILQRIPAHVLDQYKDAAKHGFSRLVAWY